MPRAEPVACVAAGEGSLPQPESQIAVAFVLRPSPAITSTDSRRKGFILAIASKAPALHPALAFERQDEVFAAAFEVLSKAVNSRVFPGASLAVTHEGKLIALKGLGNFTYESNSPRVMAETIYDLASVSKVVVTTTMAMILYERGELDLDLPLVALIPQFASEDDRRNEITLRMVLAHSSGLPAYVKLFEHARTPGELLRAACGVPLVADPGTRAEYSDIGFILLGQALAQIAEEPIDRFAQHHILGPLGMVHSTFNPPAGWRARIPPTVDDPAFRHRLIQGEVHDENASVLGGVAGHAGLFGSAYDLAVFAHCMLKGGAPILRPETIGLFTRREQTPPGSSRALGWDTPSNPSQSGKYLSPSSFGHLGYTGTSLWIDPVRRLSISLLSNRTWPDNKNQAIKEVRPRFHDAVIDCLEGQA